MKKEKETATRNETARNELGTDLSDWFCALQFAGMLTCMDEGIGNVTSALESKTMLENMFIIFTTDNVRALDQLQFLFLFSLDSPTPPRTVTSGASTDISVSRRAPITHNSSKAKQAKKSNAKQSKQSKANQAEQTK